MKKNFSISMGIATTLLLSACTTTDFKGLSGQEVLLVNKFENNPTLKINNIDNINGNRYIKVVSVNGTEIGRKNGYLSLDKGRNYIKVECGRNNSSIEEGTRLRFSEVHHFYAEPGEKYEIEYFSRAFDMPDDVSDIKYCSEDVCGIETGSDESGAICNLLLTHQMGAVKTFVFGQKRIF